MTGVTGVTGVTGAWRLLDGDGVAAADGLALDEALMTRYGRGRPDCPPTLRLYSYRSHCALVGRYQDLAAEVDLDTCGRTGTDVSRRLTGGGAIVMGRGQLGVAYVDRAPAGRRPRAIIEDLSAALAAGLAQLGVTTVFHGKNDLETGGRKIAGLGLYLDPAGAMLFHASVLADLDVELMLAVLRVPAAKLEGKAIAAVTERVTTVSAETGRRHDATTVRPSIAAGFAATFGAGSSPACPTRRSRRRPGRWPGAGTGRRPGWTSGPWWATAAGRPCSRRLPVWPGSISRPMATWSRAPSWPGTSTSWRPKSWRWSQGCAGGASTRTPSRLWSAGPEWLSPSASPPSGSLPPCSRPDARQAVVLSQLPRPGATGPVTDRATGPVTDRATGPVTATSPDYVRISMASAIALRVRSGRFSRDFEFGGINLLLSYDDGCMSDCGYCGLARSSPARREVRSFIRVEWPLVNTDDVVERLVRYEPALARICISMVTHRYAYRDTCEIARRIAARSRVPISVLVAPAALNRQRLEDLKSIGVDMIGIGLDAVTEELFADIRTHVPAGGLRWQRYWEHTGRRPGGLRPWKVNAHIVVGLGETDADLLALLVALRDRRGPPVPVLLQPGAGHADGRPPETLAAALAPGPAGAAPDRDRGLRPGPFRLRLRRGVGPCPGHTSGPGGRRGRRPRVHDRRVPGGKGEPGCTRPFGSYRPAEPFRDYPFAPEASDLAEIRQSLGLGDLVG